MPQLRGLGLLEVKGLSRKHFQMLSIDEGKRPAGPWPSAAALEQPSRGVQPKVRASPVRLELSTSRSSTTLRGESESGK